MSREPAIRPEIVDDYDTHDEHRRRIMSSHLLANACRPETGN